MTSQPLPHASTLGRYEMLAPIAAGGMASVWAARLRGAMGFSKVVAIKSMLPALADEPEYRTMFLDEARVASKLRHPNICETFDLGEDGGALFMAMEWVDGTSLYRVLRGTGKVVRPIGPELAARIIAGACAGLHAAHEAVDDDGTPLAVVHRDVSPQNMLLSSEGHVKVTDFGVAKSRGKSHATSAGQAKGKLAYMAPEQLRCIGVDRRADVFALGCVLYEITTGKKPFDADTDANLMTAILECAPAKPSTLVPDYPAPLERIVLRAMAKDANDRFASAEGLRIALERWLASRGATVTERDVAILVHERSSEEIAARRAQIHATCARGVPELDADDLVSMSSGRLPPTRLEGRAQEPDRGRQLAIGLGILITAIAFGSLLWRRPIEPQADDPIVRSVTAAVAVTPSAAIAPATVNRPPALSLHDASRVAFHVEPTDARLVVDGEPLEPGDAEVERPAAGEMRVVLVKAPNHVDRLVVVDGSTPSTLEVILAGERPSSLSSREP